MEGHITSHFRESLQPMPLPSCMQVRIHNLCEAHNLHPGLLGDGMIYCF
jgi:hypothetical protein